MKPSLILGLAIGLVGCTQSNFSWDKWPYNWPELVRSEGSLALFVTFTDNCDVNAVLAEQSTISISQEKIDIFAEEILVEEYFSDNVYRDAITEVIGVFPVPRDRVMTKREYRKYLSIIENTDSPIVVRNIGPNGAVFECRFDESGFFKEAFKVTVPKSGSFSRDHILGPMSKIKGHVFTFEVEGDSNGM